MKTKREPRTANHGILASLPPPPASQLVRRPDASAQPYDAKADRPLLQLGVRIALWGALALGCIGGALAVLRPANGDSQVVDDPADDDWIVPGPVAGVAENTVERWLAASDEERAQLAGLFVEPVPSADAATSDDGDRGLEVGRVTAVAGQRLQDDYWSVTVSAEILPDADLADATAGENESEDDGDPADPSGEQAQGPTTWFVEVAIVSDGHGGFVALTTPAVVPARTQLDPAWGMPGQTEAPQPDDPLARLVESFLGAVLAGSGDAAPYVAPGAEISAAEPAPFVELTVAEIATEDLGEGRTWVLAHVVATTEGGVRLPLSYDLTMVERVDRWEVEALSGVPTYIE